MVPSPLLPWPVKCCQLRWRALDVHHERLIIEQAKTEAGKREVELTLDVIEELLAWRAERGDVHMDEFVFATASWQPWDKDHVRTILGRVVKRANEERERRDLIPLPRVVPHTLRRTYISLMLEAGAPLHYVMDQVGHDDSKTTLEIYAQVQKRLSRRQVKRAFEELLADTETGAPEMPTGRREKMSDHAQRTTESGPRRGAQTPRGPQKWTTEAQTTPRG